MHEPITKERLEEVLALDLSETETGQDAGVGTFRGLIYEMAALLWIEGEGLSGKRPWGNSGWHHDIYVEIAKKGWCAVDLEDDEPWPTDCRWVDANLIIPAMRLAVLKS